MQCEEKLVLIGKVCVRGQWRMMSTKGVNDVEVPQSVGVVSKCARACSQACIRDGAICHTIRHPHAAPCGFSAFRVLLLRSSARGGSTHCCVYTLTELEKYINKMYTRDEPAFETYLKSQQNSFFLSMNVVIYFEPLLGRGGALRPPVAPRSSRHCHRRSGVVAARGGFRVRIMRGALFDLTIL
ncbi:hypothetical protein EVAR_53174_1 [Eumeta japonica]|uniref:Uncharacterized protein n=1 Tax=Eumeta variegata TaxID=151549 RepID=A0A4C1YZ00_EUMVA|nr:hypothetical protein EVAR_53174_1 [Eumeta japonica]